MDKIKLIHLAFIGTWAGLLNWITTNDVTFWISLATAVLIFLMSLRKFIITLIGDFRRMKDGFTTTPNKNAHGKL